MKTTIRLLLIISLFSCEKPEKVYKRTSIPLPSNEAIYTSNDNIDSIAVNLKFENSNIPNTIIDQLKKNIEAHLDRPLNENDKINKLNYKIDDEISLFNVTIISGDPILANNYIGIYQIGNFDFFTSTHADSIHIDLNSEITRFEKNGNEYLITSKTIANGQERFQRLTFRDTLNQLQWYKIEM